MSLDGNFSSRSSERVSPETTDVDQAEKMPTPLAHVEETLPKLELRKLAIVEKYLDDSELTTLNLDRIRGLWNYISYSRELQVDTKQRAFRLLDERILALFATHTRDNSKTLAHITDDEFLLTHHLRPYLTEDGLRRGKEILAQGGDV